MILTLDVDFTPIWAYKPNERMTIVIMEGGHLDGHPSIFLMTIIINSARNYYLVNQIDVDSLMKGKTTDIIIHATRSPIYRGIKTQDL